MPNALALIDEELRDLTAREDVILAEAAKGNVDPFRSELDELNEQITAKQGDKVRIKRAMERERTLPSAHGGEPTDPDLVPTPRYDARTLGERFLASEDWSGWIQKVAPNGFSEKSPVGVSPAIRFGRILPGPRQPGATIVTGASDTSAGAFVVNDVFPGTFAQGLQRPLTLRDIITNGTTNSDTVEFVKLTAQTNNAAPTAEATATGDASGTKPESALTLAKVTTTVKTIAHWIPATKRALSDAGQIRTLIDNFLRYGLEEELEDQIASGDGTGENFTGLDHTSGVQTQAFDTDILTTTRKARTKVRTVGRAIPTAYVLNPTDWETIDLLQDNEARFYGAGPFALTPARLWGLPVVESEAVAAGLAYVGDFRKCVLWDREQASIQVSDSHSDFFVRNMVAILAEMRAAFGVVQPNALVSIDVSA